MARTKVVSREEIILAYFNDENEPISARLLLLRLANAAMAKNSNGKVSEAPATKTRKPRNAASPPTPAAAS